MDEPYKETVEEGLPSFTKYPRSTSSVLDTLLRPSDTLPNGDLKAILECSIMILILEMRTLKFCKTFAKVF